MLDPALPARLESTYSTWKRLQGVPTTSSDYIHDLGAVELSPWASNGGRGVILNHERSEDSNDCHIIEIPPGGSLTEGRHLFEKTVYVLQGAGATTVWSGAGDSTTFEWKAGSLFAVPLNARHQLHNGRPDRPARLLCVTNAPSMLNTFRSVDFIGGCTWDFSDRFSGQPSFFDGAEKPDGRILTTNFVSDVRRTALAMDARGVGSDNIELHLAGNYMGAHIAEFPVGTYKKAHRHGPGAHLVVLSGEGYTLMWMEGEPPQRYDWRPGSLVTPPDRAFHQHFNTGAEPARYLALRYRTERPMHSSGLPLSWVSTRLGGDQIEFDDEDPAVRTMYDQSLAANGLTSLMHPRSTNTST